MEGDGGIVITIECHDDLKAWHGILRKNPQSVAANPRDALEIYLQDAVRAIVNTTLVQASDGIGPQEIPLNGTEQRICSSDEHLHGFATPVGADWKAR